MGCYCIKQLFSFSSPKKRYHDTYALIEDGTEDRPQSEITINQNRYIWANLSYNMPFIRVFSAFGGLAIYKYEQIKNLRYFVIDNLYGGVEVKCEHVSLHTELKKEDTTVHTLIQI